MDTNGIGIVVPTLGSRMPYLRQCLGSIRAAGKCHITVVCPDVDQIVEQLDPSLFDSLVLDPRRGLAAAINEGIEKLPSEISLINWLGDDDVLKPNSLRMCSQELLENPDADLVYGMCEYIGNDGHLLWTNKSLRYAHILMRFGPQLLPQPGALFRRSKFILVGGLSEDLSCAFDLDLFIKLARTGRCRFIPSVLASFRWHPDSKSVKERSTSIREASMVRVAALPVGLRPAANTWEIPLRIAIQSAGSLVSRRASKFMRQT